MAFATAADVAKRLVRSLTTAETQAADAAIASVTGQIADAVDQDADWADALDPVPFYFAELCILKAISVIANPLNVAAMAQSLGAASRSLTFPRSQDSGLILSDAEERRVRNVYYGSSSGSARTPSVADDVLDYADDGELNDSLS